MVRQLARLALAGSGTVSTIAGLAAIYTIAGSYAELPQIPMLSFAAEAREPVAGIERAAGWILLSFGAGIIALALAALTGSLRIVRTLLRIVTAPVSWLVRGALRRGGGSRQPAASRRSAQRPPARSGARASVQPPAAGQRYDQFGRPLPPPVADASIYDRVATDEVEPRDELR